MRRFLISCPVLLLAVAAVGAEDTVKAAATRKKLEQKITVEYKDTLLRDVIEDLKEKVEGIGILADTKGGVNLNAKIKYAAKDKAVTDILNDICDKYEMGYFVISQQGNGYDGSLKLTRGKERGYAEGEGAKPKPKTEDKPKEKPKTEDKPKEKPKTEDKPKTEEKPKTEDDPEKAEADAARKLKFAKELIEDGKLERAKERLAEIIKRFPGTKAAAEAKDVLEKLDK